MKTFLKIALCLLLAAGFAACDKDETPVVGRLEVEYRNLEVDFVSIDTEADNQIYSMWNPRTKFSVDLNPGNYSIFSSTSSNTGNSNKYFQIQAGRTTRAIYQDSGTPVIKYEYRHPPGLLAG